MLQTVSPAGDVQPRQSRLAKIDSRVDMAIGPDGGKRQTLPGILINAFCGRHGKAASGNTAEPDFL